ncbi:MAG: hypothetical protein AB7L65_00210 [Hyphomonadaceae bacterium]
MRHWLAHPLVFYPLLAVIAAAFVFLSARPDLGAQPAAAAEAGRVENGAIVLEGAALAHPEVSADQVIYVVRDGLGRPLALRLAVLPNQPPPGPAETEARFALTPETAQRIANRPVIVDVTVAPLPVTTAAGLAVSLQGAGPTQWATAPASPEPQTLRYRLPAVAAPEAVGLRAISAYADYNYGFQIMRIRIAPAETPARD